MTSVIIGAHLSIENGITGAINDALDISANCAQIFFKSPMNSKNWQKVLDEKDALKARQIIKSRKLFVVSHAQYIPNFCKEYKPSLKWQIGTIENDLINNDIIGGKGTVIHIGSNTENLDEPYENALKYFYKVIDNTKKLKTKIILENQVKTGKKILTTIEDMGYIYEMIDDNYLDRFGFCLDTQHLAVNSNYDLKTKKGVREIFTDFDDFIGLDKLTCIHLNDARSLTKDSHEDLLFGYNWNKDLKGNEEGLKELVKIAEERQIPMILETPQQYKTYQEQINLVKMLSK